MRLLLLQKHDGNRADAELFSTTIAAQLVDWEPDLEPHVRCALADDPNMKWKGLKEQFKNLVLEPLRKLTSDPDKPRMILMVVDNSEFADLDAMYILILNELVGEGTRRVNEFQEVVEPIILLAETLPVLSLCKLLGID